MKIDQIEIKAIGNFLALYHSDLRYIENFQSYKSKSIVLEDYKVKGKHHFYDFLTTYRIIRNIKEGSAGQLLGLTLKWISNEKKQDDVDEFAKFLQQQELTRGHMLISLASKVLFLNNPWGVYPMDSLARLTLEQKTTDYATYKSLIEKFKQNNNNNETINKCLMSVGTFTDTIEKNFQSSIKDLSTIRYNRFLDILLWTKGQSLSSIPSPATPSI